MAGYPDYYQRTIAVHAHGVKLVLGPTGLGKSSSIPEVVRNNPDRKFIYMAHRKELLEEMAARFNPGEYVILRRDLEVVQQVLLTQRGAFEALLADHRFVAALKRAADQPLEEPRCGDYPSCLPAGERDDSNEPVLTAMVSRAR